VMAYALFELCALLRKTIVKKTVESKSVRFIMVNFC
jgi:hypothetical protein